MRPRRDRLSFVTLGVDDLERSIAFYERVLDLSRLETPPGVSFFELGKTWLSLFPRPDLAADAGVSPAGSGFPGFSLAHNVRSAAEVDALLNHVAALGRHDRPARPPRRLGRHLRHLRRPGRVLWEVAWNPDFPHV